MSIHTGIIDRSGTLTVGNTAQNIFAHRERVFLLISNIDPSGEDMWVSLTTTAAANAVGSFKIPAGGVFLLDEFVSTNAVSAVAATSGHKFTAYEA